MPFIFVQKHYYSYIPVMMVAPSRLYTVPRFQDVLTAVVTNHTPLDNSKIPIENRPLRMAVNGPVYISLERKIIR